MSVIAFQKEFDDSVVTLLDSDRIPGVPYAAEHLVQRGKLIEVSTLDKHPYLPPWHWNYAYTTARDFGTHKYPPLFLSGVLFLNVGDEIIMNITRDRIRSCFIYCDVFTLGLMSLGSETYYEQLLMVEHSPFTIH